jgi:N-acetylglucosaminyldiphosphoundecaprenol N-acetyl-beta-D-mannosaminyltransferase
LNNSKIYINSHYPKLTVAGVYSPPYRTLSNEEEENVVKMIAASGAGIVFVALGCPKQEKWIAKMKGRIPTVMLGIGIALEVLTGQQKRTPAWIEKAGLEWLFRLLKEPKRLFKRYLITNSTFIFLILKALLLKPKTNKG